MTDSSKPRNTRRPAPKPEPVVEVATEAPVAEPTPAPAPAPKSTEKVTTTLMFKRRLSQGDHGPVVAEVQRVLAAQGFWEGAQDGRYGTLMAKAVRRFQGDRGIRPTGEVDVRTWEAMIK
jgi:peptidoglycan hydrolase-like protein with peptidoglycan-binding domain